MLPFSSVAFCWVVLCCCRNPNNEIRGPPSVSCKFNPSVLYFRLHVLPLMLYRGSRVVAPAHALPTIFGRRSQERHKEIPNPYKCFSLPSYVRVCFSDLGFGLLRRLPLVIFQGGLRTILLVPVLPSPSQSEDFFFPARVFGRVLWRRTCPALLPHHFLPWPFPPLDLLSQRTGRSFFCFLPSRRRCVPFFQFPSPGDTCPLVLPWDVSG